jgi:hypothetical protein
VGIQKKWMSIFDSFLKIISIIKENSEDLVRLFIVKTLVICKMGQSKWKVEHGTSCEISIDYDIIESKERVVSTEPAVYDLGRKTILVVETMR